LLTLRRCQSFHFRKKALIGMVLITTYWLFDFQVLHQS
jgi:hypothetical protein